MALVRKTALYWIVESTYGTDGAAADGNDMLYVPANSIGPVVDQKTPLEQNYFNARDNPSQWIPGPDGWSVDVQIPVIGLPVEADDNEDPGTTSPVDWFDTLLLHDEEAKPGIVVQGVSRLEIRDGELLSCSSARLADLVSKSRASGEEAVGAAAEIILQVLSNSVCIPYRFHEHLSNTFDQVLELR